MESKQGVMVQGGDEAVGVNPYPYALDKDVPVGGDTLVEVGSQQAIVFGTDASQVGMHPGHRTASVGEEGHMVASARWIGRLVGIKNKATRMDFSLGVIVDLDFHLKCSRLFRPVDGNMALLDGHRCLV